MKRNSLSWCSIGLAVMLIFASAVTGAAAQSSADDPEALSISSMKLSKTSTEAVLRMTLENQGSESITEFGVALAFLDGDENQIYAQPATFTGYIDEVCNWYYTPDAAIETGGTYETKDSFAGYGDAKAVAAAIRYYCKSGGAYVMIPESEWLWLSTAGKEYNKLDSRTYYDLPDQSVFDSAKDINIGYRFYLLDDYNASYYGFKQGGEWISEVEIGSLADTAGLTAGDLVLTIDGEKPTENNYAAEYAMAKIAEGQSMAWKFMREGKVYTVEIALP